MVTNDLKPNTQSAQAAKKAMSILGLIRRTFKTIDVCDFSISFNGYVCPHPCYRHWCNNLNEPLDPFPFLGGC